MRKLGEISAWRWVTASEAEKWSGGCGRGVRKGSPFPRKSSLVHSADLCRGRVMVNSISKVRVRAV